MAEGIRKDRPEPVIPQSLRERIDEVLEGLESHLFRDSAKALGEDGKALRFFRAPGRVNLIGDHTDYNGGLVLPAAIDLAVYIACRPSDSVYLSSDSEPGIVALAPDGSSVLERQPLPAWGSYVQGVLAELSAEGRPSIGFTGAIVSDIPPGRGLSSSAALETAVATAALALADFELDPWVVAEACRRAEERYAGVECGIMDQAISVMAKPGFACLIDTSIRACEYVAFPPSIELVVVDSGVRRDLSAAQYNDRRRECKEALQILRTSGVFEDLENLSRLSPEDIDTCRKLLPAVLFRRVRHVITENQRVKAFSEILSSIATGDKSPSASGSLEDLRRLVEESHKSLVDDFEAGHPITDAIVELAASSPGYLGARQTGAGWGGSVVVFSERGKGRSLGQSVVDDLTRRILKRTPDAGAGAARDVGEPSYYVCEISGGASEIPG